MGDLTQVGASLRQRLADLTAQAGAMEADLRRPHEADFAEQATERETDQTTEALEAHALAEIGQIKAALARIDAGTYGVCSACGEAIAPARMAALPWATRCIRCA